MALLFNFDDSGRTDIEAACAHARKPGDLAGFAIRMAISPADELESLSQRPDSIRQPSAAAA